MKTSEKGIEFISLQEGLRLKAYQCSSGVWTIGYGHTHGVKPGDVITKEQAAGFLKEDAMDAENVINKHLQNLNQNQFDALVSFVFNVGAGNFQSSTLLKKAKLNPNDETIAGEFIKWDKAKNPSTGRLVELAGLTRRRKEESNLYFSK